MALALRVACASHLGVGVDRRRACPHRRDVGPWYTVSVNGGATLLGTMVPARLGVCVNRGRRAHIGYPRWSGRVGEDEGAIR